MRKGNKVIYNGELLEVLKKHGHFVVLYNPLAKYPETTKQITSIDNITPATTAKK